MTSLAAPQRVPPEILSELRGLPYRWELGSKHWHLRIEDELVAIWPRGGISSTGRTKPWIATRAAIRRWKRGHP